MAARFSTSRPDQRRPVSESPLLRESECRSETAVQEPTPHVDAETSRPGEPFFVRHLQAPKATSIESTRSKNKGTRDLASTCTSSYSAHAPVGTPGSCAALWPNAGTPAECCRTRGWLRGS